MEPTLLIGDHLLSDRMAYGYRLPLLDRPLSAPRLPTRGDVVIFLFPEDRTRMFIKRVVGLPGETVELRDRVVSIDGRPLDEPYVKYLQPPREPDEPPRPTDDWGPETVPPSHLFVLGDNRDNSKDSRYWGFVPVEDLRGKAKLVYLSLDEREGAIRWSRTGHVIR
jgi:signal peptidase I